MLSAENRNIVGINAETVSNVASNDFPGHWPGEDHSWDVDEFRKKLKVVFYRNEKYHAEFDLIHIDASISNAFRRIMMAEVPSFAVEICYVLTNTSVVQDEVLAHRLGLIPLRGNQKALKELKWRRKEINAETQQLYPPTIFDTLILHLEASCTRLPNAPKTSTDPDELYSNHSIYARDIQWMPATGQAENFGNEPVCAANPDILIAKLRPGQEIAVTMHAFRGLGKDHAKFSPVATVSYRLLPQITINEPIRGKAAERFRQCFPPGVIEVTADGEAKVVGARNDTVSREVLRHEEFRGKVRLGRVRDHFIFSVESVGQWDSDAIFLEAVGILKAKANCIKRHMLQVLQRQQEQQDRDGEPENEDAMEE